MEGKMRTEVKNRRLCKIAYTLGLLLLFSPVVRAQARSEEPKTPEEGAKVTAGPADTAAVSAAALPASEDPAVPPSPRALPAWPPEPPAGDILAMFKEDLSKPLTPKKKYSRSLKLTFLPGIITTAGAAGLSMATDSELDKNYGMGGNGFVRRWGSYFGQNAVVLFVGDFAMASALHQDPRYHPSKKAGFGHRLAHALLSPFVTTSDSGKNEFNASKLIGLAAGTGAATGWHHESDRSGSLFAQRFGWSLLSVAGFNAFSEFVLHRNDPRN